MGDISNTQYFRAVQEKKLDVREVLEDVYFALTEKGYNPINQIVGYIMSGDSGRTDEGLCRDKTEVSQQTRARPLCGASPVSDRREKDKRRCPQTGFAGRRRKSYTDGEKAVGSMPACFLMGKIRNENKSIRT